MIYDLFRLAARFFSFSLCYHSAHQMNFRNYRGKSLLLHNFFMRQKKPFICRYTNIHNNNNKRCPRVFYAFVAFTFMLYSIQQTICASFKFQCMSHFIACSRTLPRIFALFRFSSFMQLNDVEWPFQRCNKIK